MRSRAFSRVLPVSAAALLVFALSGCSSLGPGGGQALKPELVRLATGGAVNSAAAPTAAIAGGYAWSSDLRIASFRAPIRGITLRGPSHSSEIYHCSADSNDGCLIDLAGPSLQDLLGASTVQVQAGTYDHVEISTCGSEGSYHAYLAGSVTLGGTSYYTSTATVLAASGGEEEVRIEYQGCGRSYPLPVPLVVSDTAGAPIAFRLYFDIRDLAWASLGESETAGGWLPGGCAGPRPSAQSAAVPYLCTGYPDVAGVVDNQPPTIERYRINDGATIGLLFLASGGQFVGGYSRRFFSEGADAHPGFNADTPVDEWTANGNGSYHLSTYGGGGPGGAPVGHYLVMPGFLRSSHSGSGTAQDANPFSYSAVRIE